MTIADPIRWDRVQRGLVEILTNASGLASGFAYGQGVYESTDAAGIVNVTLRGPAYRIAHARGSGIFPLASVAFTVDTATVGQRIGVYVNNVRHTLDVGELDTVTTIRDGLLASIALDAADGFACCTATAGLGAGEWTLAATSLGSIWSLRPLGSLSYVATPSTSKVSITQGRARVVASVEVFCKARSPRAGALNYAAKIGVALQTPSYADALALWGVGVLSIGPTLDLSAIAGGSWESRAALEVELDVLYSSASPVDHIEHIDLASQLAQPQLSSTVEASP